MTAICPVSAVVKVDGQADRELSCSLEAGHASWHEHKRGDGVTLFTWPNSSHPSAQPPPEAIDAAVSQLTRFPGAITAPPSHESVRDHAIARMCDAATEVLQKASEYMDIALSNAARDWGEREHRSTHEDH